ncbi:MAG: 50S ribosomal protein L10 [Pirellulales bacterium]|nr:50S ribosomal protein L10 [Pirellulales bacterium]
MSKYVKDLMTNDLKQKLDGVGDVLVVNVIGMDSLSTTSLRRRLRSKNISLSVVKNSMAKRATEGTPLAPAFEGLEGSAAVVWGAEDVVSLAKEVVSIAEDKEFEGFQTVGGAMDGQPLSADEVTAVSKWPSREEMLAKLVGQILGPGAQLASQIGGPGGTLAGQIKSKGEEDE